MVDPLSVGLAELTRTLRLQGIRYAVGGSIASGAHGEYRGTMDGDLVAAISQDQSRSLGRALGKDWYVDDEMMERALRAGRAFNLIHIPTAAKFDIFPAKTDFHYQQLERASDMDLMEGSVRCTVTTA